MYPKPVATEHDQQHATLLKKAQRLIEDYRYQIGLEETWSIEVRVCCAQELAHEASIWWDAEVFYARMHIRCSVWQQDELLCWLVLHELCELQTWRTGNYILSVLAQVTPRGWSQEKTDFYQKQLRREWQQVRNQEIECRLYGLTGMRRPGHLVQEDPAELGEKKEPLNQ